MYGLKLLASDCALIDYSSDLYRVIDYEEALQNMDMFYNVERAIDKGLVKNYIGTGSLIADEDALLYMRDLFSHDLLFTLTEIALPVIKPKDSLDWYLFTNKAFFFSKRGTVLCLPRGDNTIKSSDYHVVNKSIDYVVEMTFTEDTVIIDCVHVKVELDLNGISKKYRKFTENQFKRFILLENG